MEFNHIPVLYNEVLNGLNIKKDGIYIDGTLGGGGHSLGILERLGEKGRLIATDLDIEAIEASKKKLEKYLDKVTFVRDNYKNIPLHLDRLNIEKVDGILLDLGISSHQIDTAERGFAYSKDATLDMRMDASSPLSALEVIGEWSESELKKIFFTYGEEKHSARIARAIVREREIKPITTTFELADLVARNYPKGYKHGHPAKRVFQAVRIAVNGELDGLGDAITDMTRRLKPTGRMCVITFHSLEDRIVKNCFKDLELDCVCNKALPICVCGKNSEIKLINKKPITASIEELKQNKRAESAKLRIIEKK